jgi:1-hydroxycarotenoid 3,4-desaturase
VSKDRIAVIGAGVGGLAASLELAARGLDVVVFEQAQAPGGKMREIEVGGMRVDSGPTVFTMRWVFDELFAAVGASLAEHLTLQPVETLARHAWSENECLDLFADVSRSVDAIGQFAGPAEARRYRAFSTQAGRIYRTLERPFLRSARPTPASLVRSVGLRGLGDLWSIDPFATLWSALGEYFHDPRLRQLFGRYATYCGSSPFLAPATLMLVAHVERDGVWLVEGGMHRMAVALANLAVQCGVTLRYGERVREISVSHGRASGIALDSGETFDADAVLANADIAALSSGRFGDDVARSVPHVPASARSLSAVTWSMVAQTSGFPLLRHNVFFSGDYAVEFQDIFEHARLPIAPTVYVCAQDRNDKDCEAHCEAERLLCLVNAPPTGDVHHFTVAEIETCEKQTFGLLQRCGLRVDRLSEATRVTTPSDFERMFPATGGALYGQAAHGWRASFSRPGSRSKMPGLYLAGGSVHPGPGVPMAALSGRLAAASIVEDFASTSRSRRVAIHGGTSMR